MGDEERRFIDVFRMLSLQAGAVARRLQGEIRNHGKEGRTPESAALTPVDLAAQDVILRGLHELMPEVDVDAEEETDTVHLFPAAGKGKSLVVVDPVDGTLNYSRGSSEYAVMGAWIRDGVYCASVVHFPAWGETYAAARGEGCWRWTGRAGPERVSVQWSEPRVLVPPSVPRAWREALQTADMEPSVSRCSAVDACAPATGRGAASLTRKRPDRRRSVGFLITEEAGGVVTVGGRRWDGLDPDRSVVAEGPGIVAGSEAVAARVLAALPLAR